MTQHIIYREFTVSTGKKIIGSGEARYTFTVKPGTPPGETAVNLDAGGASWAVRIRDPQQENAAPAPLPDGDER